MNLVRFKTVFLSLAILAVLILIGSQITSGILTRDAVFAQRAEKLEAAELFGDTQEQVLIGSPQKFLALDPKAFMEGTGDQGAKLINDVYLRENNIYPIQVKTVEFFRDLTLLACLLGGGLMFGLWLLANRSTTRPSQMA
jgi:hypothetical protein